MLAAWDVKPPFGTLIDYDHPFAQALTFFAGALEANGGPTTVDSVTQTALTLAGGAAWGGGGTQPGIVCTANNARAQGTWPTNHEPNWPITIACAFYQIGTESGGSPYFGIWPSPLGIYVSGAGYYGVYPNQTSAVNSAQTPTVGKEFVISATVYSTSQAVYVNGVLSGTGSLSLAAASYSSSNVAFGDTTSFSGRNPNAVLYWGGVWAAGRDAGWHRMIGSSPKAIYDMFPSRRIFGKKTTTTVAIPYWHLFTGLGTGAINAA